LSFGFRQRFSLPTNVSTPSHLLGSVGFFSTASFAATALEGVMQLPKYHVHPACSQPSWSLACRHASDWPSDPASGQGGTIGCAVGFPEPVAVACLRPSIRARA